MTRCGAESFGGDRATGSSARRRSTEWAGVHHGGMSVAPGPLGAHVGLRSRARPPQDSRSRSRQSERHRRSTVNEAVRVVGSRVHGVRRGTGARPPRCRPRRTRPPDPAAASRRSGMPRGPPARSKTGGCRGALAARRRAPRRASPGLLRRPAVLAQGAPPPAGPGPHPTARTPRRARSVSVYRRPGRRRPPCRGRRPPRGGPRVAQREESDGNRREPRAARRRPATSAVSRPA